MEKDLKEKADVAKVELVDLIKFVLSDYLTRMSPKTKPGLWGLSLTDIAVGLAALSRFIQKIGQQKEGEEK